MGKQGAKHDPGLAGMDKEVETTAVTKWLWKVDMQESTKRGGRRGKHKRRRVKSPPGK